MKVFPSDSRFLGCPAPHTALDFYSTLGFPGEGPCFGPRLVIISALLPWTWGVLQPRDASDLARQKLRSSELPAGRPVQARTRSNRDSLVAAFSQWLVEVAGSLETLLSKRPFDPEELCGWITSCGRDLYGSRPYWHFAETVNAVTALKPAFRRQAQGAWDLAFMWLSEEQISCARGGQSTGSSAGSEATNSKDPWELAGERGFVARSASGTQLGEDRTLRLRLPNRTVRSTTSLSPMHVALEPVLERRTVPKEGRPRNQRLGGPRNPLVK